MRHDIRNRFSQEGKVKTAAVIGWTIFVLLLAIIAIVGWRTVYYYRHLKAGDIIELPNIGGKFTVGEVGFGSAARVTAGEVDTADAPALGAPAGKEKFTVVMFGDFECPFSRESSVTFRRMAVKYGDRVRFIYRDFPLAEIHAGAFVAASAAECAREQMRFWEYYDRLYANAPNFSTEDLTRYAQEAGLDATQFERCLTSNRYEGRVAEDLSAAERLGLRGTPTFYIDGRKVEGSLPEDDFGRILDKLLQ
jgi:protein-disulfide isomerase